MSVTLAFDRYGTLIDTQGVWDLLNEFDPNAVGDSRKNDFKYNQFLVFGIKLV